MKVLAMLTLIHNNVWVREEFYRMLRIAVPTVCTTLCALPRVHPGWNLRPGEVFG